MVGFSYVLVYGAMGISEMFDEPMFDLSGCISHVLCFTSIIGSLGWSLLNWTGFVVETSSAVLAVVAVSGLLVEQLLVVGSVV